MVCVCVCSLQGFVCLSRCATLRQATGWGHMRAHRLAHTCKCSGLHLRDKRWGGLRPLGVWCRTRPALLNNPLLCVCGIADASGYSTNIADMRNGMTQQQIFNAFVGSPEWAGERAPRHTHTRSCIPVFCGCRLPCVSQFHIHYGPAPKRPPTPPHHHHART